MKVDARPCSRDGKEEPTSAFADHFIETETLWTILGMLNKADQARNSKTLGHAMRVLGWVKGI